MHATLFHSPLWKRQLRFTMCLLAIASATVFAAGQKPNAIHPGEQWLDDRGKLIQAHGGGVLHLHDEWFWFGEDRTPTNDPAKRYVSCYSSKDLVHWKFRNQVLALADPENLGTGWVLERPKVFYNAGTRKFVMYVHLDSPDYKLARVAVLTSSTVDGSYTYLKSFRPLDQESRDIGQFIDDDGAAYLIFESRPTHGFFIAKLSDDYLSVARKISFIEAPLEGGAVVHLGNRYYVLGSHLSGWRPNPNVYATASALTGPWSAMKDIAPSETNTYDSQSSMLIKVKGSTTTSVIYVGDRWKPRELWDSRYIWMPLKLDNDSLSLPKPHDWTIDIPTGATSVATP